MSTPRINCPNCIERHAPEDVCILGTLLSIVGDRIGPLSQEQLDNVARNWDNDHFWDEYGGPATDYVEGLTR